MNRLLALGFGIVALSVIARVSLAATTENDYLAARDEQLARFAKFETQKPTTAELQDHDKAIDALGALLGKVIGPSNVKGFPGAGISTVETLIPDLGSGLLDGVAWMPDEDTRLVVTTETLLQKWLASNRELPQTMEAALKSERFYTIALTYDVHWAWHAELPVRKPPGATFAVAFLGWLGNDVGEYVPNRIAITVVRPPRVYFFEVKSPRLPQFPECHELWEGYLAKMDAAIKKHDSDEYSRLEDVGEVAYRECFGRLAPRQPYFPSVVRKAQAFVDRVK